MTPSRASTPSFHSAAETSRQPRVPLKRSFTTAFDLEEGRSRASTAPASAAGRSRAPGSAAGATQPGNDGRAPVPAADAIEPGSGTSGAARNLWRYGLTGIFAAASGSLFTWAATRHGGHSAAACPTSAPTSLAAALPPPSSVLAAPAPSPTAAPAAPLGYAPAGVVGLAPDAASGTNWTDPSAIDMAQPAQSGLTTVAAPTVPSALTSLYALAGAAGGPGEAFAQQPIYRAVGPVAGDVVATNFGHELLPLLGAMQAVASKQPSDILALVPQQSSAAAVQAGVVTVTLPTVGRSLSVALPPLLLVADGALAERVSCSMPVGSSGPCLGPVGIGPSASWPNLVLQAIGRAYGWGGATSAVPYTLAQRMSLLSAARPEVYDVAAAATGSDVYTWLATRNAQPTQLSFVAPAAYASANVASWSSHGYSIAPTNVSQSTISLTGPNAVQVQIDTSLPHTVMVAHNDAVVLFDWVNQQNITLPKALLPTVVSYVASLPG